MNATIAYRILVHLTFESDGFQNFQRLLVVLRGLVHYLYNEFMHVCFTTVQDKRPSQ